MSRIRRRIVGQTSSDDHKSYGDTYRVTGADFVLDNFRPPPSFTDVVSGHTRATSARAGRDDGDRSRRSRSAVPSDRQQVSLTGHNRDN